MKWKLIAARANGYESCRCDEAMTYVVHHHTEAFQCPHAEQSHIAWLGKDYFVIRFLTLGGENCIPDLALNLLLCGRRKHSFSPRTDTN